MKLIPIDQKGVELLKDEFNSNVSQMRVFFNILAPVRVEDMGEFFTHRMDFKIVVNKKLPSFSILDNGGELIGVGGYYDFEPHGNTLNGKLWIVIARDAIRQYNDALECLIEWGYEKAGLHKIYVMILSDLGTLARYIQKYGFDKEGELRDHIKLDNKWRSVKVYGKIFKSEAETKAENESISQKEVVKISDLSNEKFMQLINGSKQ